MMVKIWLLTTNCKGKTTFAEQKYYRDIKLFDTDVALREICNRDKPKRSKWRIPVPQDAITFLGQKTESSCLMTSMQQIHIPFENLNDIEIGIVCLPLKKLIERLHTRKRQDPSYKNETEKSLTSYWEKLYQYGIKNQVPIYTSFIQAIDTILEKYDTSTNL